MSLAYAVTNAASGLAVGAFTLNSGSISNAAYLNDADIGNRASFNSAGNLLIVDLGSAQSLTGVAILNHNVTSLTGNQGFRVRAADDIGITAGVINPKTSSTLNATAPAAKDHVLQFAATAAKRYWELAFDVAAAQTIYLGEVMLFTSVQLSRQRIYGSGEAEEILGTKQRMQYGTTRASYLGGPIRRLEWKWADLTAAQRIELRTMWAAARGFVTPLLLIFSYEAVSTAAAAAEQECLYGNLEKNEFRWAEHDYLLYGPDDLLLRGMGREVGS